MLERRAFLGQVPLILGPGSWGFGGIPIAVQPIPPFYGEWGYMNPDGDILDSGQVGPFGTAGEASQAAAAEARKHGVMNMPLDGFARVKDSRGRPVGTVA